MVVKCYKKSLLLEDWSIFRNVVVMNGRTGKRIIMGSDINSFPLTLASSVIYVGKRGAIRERIITNACNAVGDYYACK